MSNAFDRLNLKRSRRERKIAKAAIKLGIDPSEKVSPIVNDPSEQSAIARTFDKIKLPPFTSNKREVDSVSRVDPSISPDEQQQSTNSGLSLSTTIHGPPHGRHVECFTEHGDEELVDSSATSQARRAEDLFDATHGSTPPSDQLSVDLSGAHGLRHGDKDQSSPTTSVNEQRYQTATENQSPLRRRPGFRINHELPAEPTVSDEDVENQQALALGDNSRTLPDVSTRAQPSETYNDVVQESPRRSPEERLGRSGIMLAVPPSIPPRKSSAKSPGGCADTGLSSNSESS